MAFITTLFGFIISGLILSAWSAPVPPTEPHINPNHHAYPKNLHNPGICPSDPYDEPPQLDHISISGRQFVDSYGRVRIFNGINVDNKSSPYIPDYLTDDQITYLSQDIGFNLVRATFMWAGYEPVQGQKQQSYKQAFTQLTNRFADVGGMWTLLDVHQDQFSQNWCGEGLPEWLSPICLPYVSYYEQVAPFPYPGITNVPPYPLNTSNPYGGIQENYCSYPGNNGLYYFSEIDGQLFSCLYNNVGGVQDMYVQVLADLAQWFSHDDNIIGYEIINEPFPGNIYNDFNLFINSTYGDLVNLQAFYDAVSTGVRQHDNKHLLFFEPLVTNGEVLARHAGFSHPPGGSEYANLDVLAFHTYCDVTESYASDCEYAGEEYAQDCQDIINGDPNYCDILWTKQFQVRNQDAIQLNVPMMVTEYGNFDVNTTVNYIANQYILSQANINFTSTINWDILNLYQYPDLFPALARTYAQAIAGQPISNSFNPTTLIYTLTFEINPFIPAPTVIFVPVTIHYTNGYTVTTSPAGLLRWAKPQGNSNTVELYANGLSGLGRSVTVTIAPKQL